MNLRECSFSPLNLFSKIKNYVVYNGSDSLADFLIDLTYQDEQTTVNWSIKRSFESFESLHGMLAQKFEKVPFLPCRLILPLSDKERIERASLMETYMNICIKTQEILNSFEFRLFIDLETNLQIYTHPPQCIFQLKQDEFTPIAVNYIPSNRTIISLTSIYQESSNFSIKKILNKFSGFWSKDKQLVGRLFILREKIAKSLNFEPKASFDFFDDAPTTLEVSEINLQVFIGFVSGIVCLYKIEQPTKLMLLSKFECHKQPVRIMYNIDQEGFILSTSNDRTLMVNDQSSTSGFYHEETQFLHPVSAMYYNFKFNLLFLGDQSGRMHIYKRGNEFGSKKYTLLITEKLSEFQISCIATDSRESYIYVGYDCGFIEIYETGKGFQSTPTLIKNFKIGIGLKKMKFGMKNKTLIMSHGKGMLSFCDYADSNNFFTHFCHQGSLTDFYHFEEERMIFSTGVDGFLKVFLYEDKLFSPKCAESRKLLKWRSVDVEDYIIPNNNAHKNISDAQNKVPLQVNSTIPQQIETNMNSEVKKVDDEEDDLIGWDS